jgi:phosphoglycolate phosphatase
MIETIIFDFSGVLSDDFLSTYKTAMEVFAIRGLEKVSVEEFKDIYELPWLNIYKKMGLDVDIDEEYRHWGEISPKYEDLVVPIDGAKETLVLLKEKGIKTIILSSRNTQILLQELKNHGFYDLIDDVQAGVHDKREIIFELMKRHEVEAESTVYIGDMPHDIDTAKYAGVKSIAVLGGFGKEVDLKKANPDFIINNISDLVGLVESI